MKSLFEATKLSSIPVKNHLVRSATYEGMADEKGHLTDRLFHLYEELAKGETGTIITSLAAVSSREKWIPWQLGMDNDSFIEDYQKLTDEIHAYGTKIIMQLAAVGSQTIADYQPERSMWGPSAVEDIGYKNTPLVLTRDDILTYETEFAAAALRAKKSGFDGIQLHAAHGYLLSKFLTPYYNRRTDEYGGNIENRSRFLAETVEKIREQAGIDYPVLIKINAEDFLEDGMTFEECIAVCKTLKLLGVNAIELSGGSRSSRKGEGYSRTNLHIHSYFFEYAVKLQKEAGLPVIAVGGNRDLNKLTNLLNQSEVGFFSFARPLVREPGLFKRWKNGDPSQAKCISCNRCSMFGNNHCVFNEVKL